ncbi:MAG: undecaprenyl-diphosphate phosphatase [Firmicutes bacterium]|nr:undecaprenyl-diphosphate phosphatase [Bacillota bacterium]
MNILEAVIIGIIQGLTEFLPISSSGHTILAGRILGVEANLAFELILHLATLCAVIIVMRKDIFALVKKPFQKETGLLLSATAVTTVILLLFLDFFKSTFDGQFLPYCFIITAIMLLCAGFFKQSQRKMTYLDALIIGVVQGCAALPGISRSGSTIAAGTMLGQERGRAARFSFLLSIPVIIGSSVVEITGGGLSGVAFLPLFFGFFAAFVSGLLALRLMLKLFSRSADYFAIYLLALSILLLLNDFILHWF